MIRQLLLLLLLSLLITSCAGAPAPTQAPLPAQSPIPEQPTESIIASTNTPVDTSTPLPTDTPAPTSTRAPTSTPAVTATDTPLPTLVLPTEAVNPPVRQVWDGTPTYPGDSKPGYAFRVTYDPDVWGLTTDQFGFPALGHRTIPNCVISVTSGRGLPPSMSVEHEMVQIEDKNFDIGTVYEGGVKQFVTFTGGDGTILTAFEVTFQQDSDACVKDATTVISTLQSVPISRATPAP